MRLIIVGYLGNGQVVARHAVLHLTPAADWLFVIIP